MSLARVWDHATTDVDTTAHHVETDLDVRTAYADPVALERIVSNLLANVVSHTPEGTNVVLRSWNEDGAVIVAVDDDGPGVPDDVAEAVNASSGEHLSQTWNGGASFRVRLPDRGPQG